MSLPTLNPNSGPPLPVRPPNLWDAPEEPDPWKRFETSVAGMADVPQWHLFRLDSDPATRKYRKRPWSMQGDYAIDASNPENWHDFDTVLAAVRARDCQGGAVRYAFGFRLTREAGYFLLDLDKCLTDGKPNDLAWELLNKFPGAMHEISCSGNGLHIIGVCQPLEHSNKHENTIELYTHSQSIAFGINYQCVGVTDVHCDSQVKALVNQYLTRIPSTPTLTSFECKPTGLTDEQIIEKARKSHSALRKLQGKATFSELFDGLVAEGNENDLALARCLAFWTGRDPVQVERIMHLSKRVRDKWSHRRKQTTWLRQTIEKACAGCEQVYLGRSTARVGTQIGSTTNAIAHGGASAGQVGSPTAGTAISDAAATAVDRILEAIKDATSELVLANQIAPEIQAAQFPLVLQAKVVQAYKSKLKKMGADLGVAQVRALLAPNGSPSPQSEELPAWARPYVYVNDGDHFFNTESCTPKTPQGFRANYNRYMPRGDFGRHGDAAEACLTRFGMETVDRLGYKPDEGARYIWQGARYANLYNPKTVPLVPAEYSQVGRAGIQAFCDHFFEMCGRRQDVCNELFHWFAHNVQFPGRKIRWAPLIKGINGDGKTLVFSILRAAMGEPNVSVTGNAVLAVQSGFNDWATGSAVNIIEEVYLTGNIKYQIYNSIKEMITNDVISINPKGRVAFRTHNTTNHAATTNHTNALPLSADDRRWFVIFTPWSSRSEMLEKCKIDEAGWKVRIAQIAAVIEQAPGELRKWLLAVQIPATFQPNGEAMVTPEKRRMQASSSDEIETLAMSIINAGGLGITPKCLSSHLFSKTLTMRCLIDSVDAPLPHRL